ncbi:hypothetical protein NQ815_14575 [Acinetobacter baumannii]|uniref:hypothetical protein n=1 Tax=Acinetobacter baumannii TaxID=470 RepID=UPI00233F946F|nr:hypothetical protein [Acinetobacter baumannii]MDC4814949.1 hypothetical protein [Acinetobacter baumannii]
MLIQLELISELDITQLRQYDDEYDTEISVLADICAEFSKNKLNQFKIQAFSNELWPVDIETDLVVLLEQLPACIREINLGSDCSVDLYEQGINREILFKFNQGNYTCYGQSHDGTWAPSYVEDVSQSDLLKMLRAFLNQFLSALKYKHSNKYLLQWLSGNT